MNKVTDISTRKKSKPESFEEKARRILKQYDREMDEEPQYSGDPKNLKEDPNDESEK